MTMQWIDHCLKFDPSRELGRGVKSTVFYGRYGSLEVAVKRINCVDNLDAEKTKNDIQKIYREKVIMHKIEQLRHRNIVGFYYSAVSDKHLYLALELCQGTLKDYVKDTQMKDNFSPLKVNISMANGLQYLHSQNVVHRDLKPENVFLVARRKLIQNVVLGDFGTSKYTVEDMFSFTGASGTMGYIPHEFCEAMEKLTNNEILTSKLSIKSDIFALGCLFYYTNTNGGHPFGTVFQRQSNIRNASLPSLEHVADCTQTCEKHVDDCLHPCKELLKEMLSHNPEERPTAIEIVIHPALWMPEKIVSFFKYASDTATKMYRNSPVSIGLLEVTNVIPNQDWIDLLPPNLKKVIIDRGKLYSGKGSSIVGLLRAIRNVETHYGEYTEDVQTELGSFPDEHAQFWMKLCPKLLMHVHRFVTANVVSIPEEYQRASHASANRAESPQATLAIPPTTQETTPIFEDDDQLRDDGDQLNVTDDESELTTNYKHSTANVVSIPEEYQRASHASANRAASPQATLAIPPTTQETTPIVEDDDQLRDDGDQLNVTDDESELTTNYKHSTGPPLMSGNTSAKTIMDADLRTSTPVTTPLKALGGMIKLANTSAKTIMEGDVPTTTPVKTPLTALGLPMMSGNTSEKAIMDVDLLTTTPFTTPHKDPIEALGPPLMSGNMSAKTIMEVNLPTTTPVTTPLKELDRNMPTTNTGFKEVNDPVHGCIKIPKLCVKIMYTPEFQRLRSIKQLGVVSYVYPGAVHTRFDHSIGVCHIAGQLIKSLKEHQPELNITDTDVKCVEIAGLCHDLGYGPFSHMFDEKIIPHILESDGHRHAEFSRMMFDHLVEKNALIAAFEDDGLTYEHRETIKDIITGKRPASQAGKDFLYEIVSNKETGIDVDKWDYVARDCLMLGFNNNFDYHRCIQMAKVLSVHGRSRICFRDESATDLTDMFYTAITLHRRAYKHADVQIVENMMTNAMVKALQSNVITFSGNGGQKLTLKQAIEGGDMTAYCQMTDNIIDRIRYSDSEHFVIKDAQVILRDIDTRKMYILAGQKRLNSNQIIKQTDLRYEIEKWILAKVNRRRRQPQLYQGSIMIDFVEFDYGKTANKGPFDNVWFYEKGTDRPKWLPKEMVSHMLPDVYPEQQIRLFCKDKEDAKDVSFALDEWCKLQEYPIADEQ